MVKDGFESFNEKRFFLMVGASILCTIILILLIVSVNGWGWCYDTLVYANWAVGSINVPAGANKTASVTGKFLLRLKNNVFLFYKIILDTSYLYF
jgi:uncharacterized membrane protein